MRKKAIAALPQVCFGLLLGILAGFVTEARSRKRENDAGKQD